MTAVTAAITRPHSYSKNCIAYVGTHDNEPVNGWMETAAPEDVACAVRYLNLTKKEAITGA